MASNSEPLHRMTCTRGEGLDDSVAPWSRLLVLPVACAVILSLAMLIGSCTREPADHPRVISTAFRDYLDTSVGQLFEVSAAQHPGESGFAIIRRGRQAFTARIALTELAEKSLDVQYYIWEVDATGRILAEHLIRAADRGVRVRVLVDDINLAGRDPLVAAIDAHPVIEVQVFNPFSHRDNRGIDFFIDLARINHRMHNKVMVADNALAIVGGRNIGDHYFEVATDANFRDLDIAAAGPIVRDISNVFDHFWNGEWAVPVGELVDRPYTEAELREAAATMRVRIAEDNYPHPLDQDVDSLKAELSSIRDEFIWAPGQIVWDDPATLHFPRPRRRDGRGAVEDVAPSRRPGGPMTYRVGGRQVVVISAGGYRCA